MSSTDKPKKEKYSNELIYEKSPYLLQHAHNPVDWNPWGDKAFVKAEKQNKPIFLSIGYSTCHWCHVMAHESFEDPEIGAKINEVFIPVKVDREERPDIDNIYMNVCQMMTGGGGWPLTILLTPKGKPFFAGTYFPPEGQYGSVGLKEIVTKVKELWEKNPQEALESADKIVNVLENISQPAPREELNKNIFKETYNSLKEGFDIKYGGFGMIQKFPSPHNLLFLMRYWKRESEENALEMALKTLDNMRYGGIYDHIGFGFHRYAVDPQWLVPHFEKMLYDQAMISIAYLEAYQITGNTIYKESAEEIFEYVLRDMQSPEGGFYSAEDADSEGEEGKFYLWSEDEIKSVLDQQADLIIELFNIKHDGNFKEESTGMKMGKNIFHLKPDNDFLVNFSKKVGSDDELHQKIKKSREKLFNARKKRIHPHKDDKILTDWNGLMIAALAKGSRTLWNKKYVLAAEKAADFIIKKLYNGNKLLHRYRDHDAAFDGNLDDYSFFIWGLLELYQTTFKNKYLNLAFKLNNILLKEFLDKKKGGLFFTPYESERILIRKKESYDSALPSGNSVHMLNLLKMAQISKNKEIKNIATNIVPHFSPKIKRSPLAHVNLMNALDFEWGPSYELVIVPSNLDEDINSSYLFESNNELSKLLKKIGEKFIPNITILINNQKTEDWPFAISDTFKNKTVINEKTTYYLCSLKECKAPTNDINDIINYLD
ncbi:thioredoxin domain-containing protein [Methanobacterium alcaliphilum]|uniref:thioredoxin domain-containing protein n=1 Tax=Methanobacterium alcaliphilum TaxID=392018 RepID=UPI00200A003E|nr:thioredoxin domain-containing protein [Methanobacterium alcaliphilum]MCK9150810.1 thioredoxin domain-containing protein [Methanobacterium alcaliphilum]